LSQPTDDAARAVPLWRIYRGDGTAHHGIARLPEQPPRWRSFRYDIPPRDQWAPHPVTGWPHEAAQRHEGSPHLGPPDAAGFAPPSPDSALSRLGSHYRIRNEEVLVGVNAALHLRRPLLVTGEPGTGKTLLAYSIAHELGLGPVLRWNITSRSMLQDGLYDYDILGRVNDSALHNGSGGPSPAKEDLGLYLTLGPLGDALLPRARPRLLLIDEIDKSDIDLPNDLLHTLETGTFDIPELRRIAKPDEAHWVLPADGEGRVPVHGGRVHCAQFPVVVMTSNQEREFPAAFQRRCIRVTLPKMSARDLADMTRGYFEDEPLDDLDGLIGRFTRLRDEDQKQLATDQLLNLVYLRTRDDALTGPDRDRLLTIVLQSLNGA
jgi:MoxR-like ATPase